MNKGVDALKRCGESGNRREEIAMAYDYVRKMLDAKPGNLMDGAE